MPKSIYVQFLSERPNSSMHYLDRLVKVLNHFISIEPEDKPKGFECHHIVPKAKSWKPEWEFEKDNHLKVPTKAHYVIHHLMWKAFPKDYAMTKAFYQMSNRLNEKITAKVYEVLKLEVSEIQSKAQNGKPLSKETKQKMRKSHIGKTHSEESKQKMRRPKTEEWKKNQSEAMKRKESLSKIRRIK